MSICYALFRFPRTISEFLDHERKRGEKTIIIAIHRFSEEVGDISWPEYHVRIFLKSAIRNRRTLVSHYIRHGFNLRELEQKTFKRIEELKEKIKLAGFNIIVIV